MAQGTGFGKTILIGDQFVLDEVPAIVSAISYETLTTVERIDGEGWVLEDNRIEVPGYKEKKKEQQVGSINRILEVMNFDAKRNPIKITVAGDLLAGSGVGASAASCVSLARALSAEFDLGYSIEEINRVAWQGEFPYHGIASGVDNTASTYGGLLRFWLKEGKQNFEQIKTPSSFEIVLCNSGITANTAALDDFIDEQKKDNWDLFRSRLDIIVSQGSAMKAALEAGDLATVGQIMTAEPQAPGRYGHVPRDPGSSLQGGPGEWCPGRQGHRRRPGRLHDRPDTGQGPPGKGCISFQEGRV